MVGFAPLDAFDVPAEDEGRAPFEAGVDDNEPGDWVAGAQAVEFTQAAESNGSLGRPFKAVVM